MPYTMKSVTTRPVGKQWWNEVDSAAAQRLVDFYSAYPGVVSVTRNTGTDPNTWETVFVFESQAAQQAMAQACQANADFLARKAYLTSNGFTTNFTFS